MSRKLTLLFSLVMVLAISVPAAGQGDEAVAPEEMDGLERAYARTYVVPAMMAPDTSRINFQAMGEEMPLVAVLGVFVFEDDDAAEENVPYFAAGFLGETYEVEEYDEEEVDDLGDEAYSYTAETDLSMFGIGGLSSEVALLVAREDEVVYFATTLAGDPEPTNRELIEFMMDGEIGDVEDVDFSDDGTSTGGGFDTMPQADDELLKDLEPAFDIQLEEEDLES